jgi:hypothetical protein
MKTEMMELSAEQVEMVSGGTPLQGAAIAVTGLTIAAGVLAAPAAVAFGAGVLVALGLGMVFS